MPPCDQDFVVAPSPRAEFPTTHWGVVLTAADSTAPSTDAALEQFCRIYWRPVYAFIRRQHQSPEDALDLTQEFFARFLEKEQIKRADPQRGRLRSFLLISVKHFLAKESALARAQKRGGGYSLLSFEQLNEAEPHFLALILDPAAPPDQAYEQHWALTLLNDMISGVRQQCAAMDGWNPPDSLVEYVWGNPRGLSQAELAAQLGMTLNALGVAVHRLRRRCRALLREAVARTVVNPDEVDAELRHLMGVIGS